MALVSHSSCTNYRSKVNAIAQSMASIGRFIGPLIGSNLFAYFNSSLHVPWNIITIFFIMACICIISSFSPRLLSSIVNLHPHSIHTYAQEVFNLNHPEFSEIMKKKDNKKLLKKRNQLKKNKNNKDINEKEDSIPLPHSNTIIIHPNLNITPTTNYTPTSISDSLTPLTSHSPYSPSLTIQNSLTEHIHSSNNNDNNNNDNNNNGNNNDKGKKNNGNNNNNDVSDNNNNNNNHNDVSDNNNNNNDNNHNNDNKNNQLLSPTKNISLSTTTISIPQKTVSISQNTSTISTSPQEYTNNIQNQTNIPISDDVNIYIDEDISLSEDDISYDLYTLSESESIDYFSSEENIHSLYTTNEDYSNESLLNSVPVNANNIHQSDHPSILPQNSITGLPSMKNE
ncbi:hypothetical protein WA158_007283 [Blastocystis sp. Blastoise]